MIRIRKADQRGHGDHGWLKTWHTFSFADYHDPEHHRFRALRVMNEDFVAGGAGFPMHPHRDMEIVTYVLQGALEHRDSMGNHGIIKPGIMQRMSAGTGVFHSESNPLPDTTTHLYQIWIMPKLRGIKPGYEERALPAHDQTGRWVLVASPDGAQGSVTINADTRLFAARLGAGESLRYELPDGHAAWVQVTKGSAKLNGQRLETGDGAAVEDVRELLLEDGQEAEILMFDLD